MRKILLSLFIINILLSFFIFFDLESTSINDKVFKSGEEKVVTLKIEKEINDLDRNSTIDKLQNITEKYQADMIFKVFHNAPGESLNVSKYIFFNDSNKLFKNIRIDGLIIKNYDRSNGYLCNLEKVSNNSQNKLGEILILKPDTKFKISTFENLKQEKYMLSGFYTFNIENNKLENFIEEMKSELKVEISKTSNLNNSKMIIPPILKIIPMSIVFLLSAIVVFYDLLSKYKDIGVKKLNGFSYNRLRVEYYKEIGLLYFASSLVSYIILGFLYLKFNNVLYLELLIKTLKFTILLFIIVCLILLIPIKFMDKITIVSVIKNKKPVQIMKRFSLLFKIIFTAILLGLFIFGLKLYMPISSFYSENLFKWEDSINYAHVSLSYEKSDLAFDDMIWEMVQQKKLYVHANKKGGLQILVPEEYKSEQTDSEIRNFENAFYNAININCNYLKKNSVLDTKGKRIFVDEDENINYILVPEKYKRFEKEIIYAMELNLYSLHDVPQQFLESRLNDQKALHNAAPELFAKDFGEIKVIIINNEQEHFTYDLFKYPETNNMVKDRILIVNNNKAGIRFDISTNGGYLIKVNNHEEPFLSISEKVDELGLGAYYNQAYSAYSNVAGQVNMYLGILSQIAVIFGIAGITIAILITYSIMIYMEKEKMELSVKLLNGYSFIGRHGKKLLRTILFYIFFLPSFIFVRGNATETRALALLLVGIVILDLLLTYIFISIYEKRNIKDILKGN